MNVPAPLLVKLTVPVGVGYGEVVERTLVWDTFRVQVVGELAGSDPGLQEALRLVGARVTVRGNGLDMDDSCVESPG